MRVSLDLSYSEALLLQQMLTATIEIVEAHERRPMTSTRNLRDIVVARMACSRVEAGYGLGDSFHAVV